MLACKSHVKVCIDSMDDHSLLSLHCFPLKTREKGTHTCTSNSQVPITQSSLEATKDLNRVSRNCRKLLVFALALNVGKSRRFRSHREKKLLSRRAKQYWHLVLLYIVKKTCFLLFESYCLLHHDRTLLLPQCQYADSTFQQPAVLCWVH